MDKYRYILGQLHSAFLVCGSLNSPKRFISFQFLANLKKALPKLANLTGALRPATIRV